MRIPIIAGNWKMNKTIAEAVALVKEMTPRLTAIPGVEKVICPPFTALSAVKEAIGDAEIGLGAKAHGAPIQATQVTRKEDMLAGHKGGAVLGGAQHLPAQAVQFRGAGADHQPQAERDIQGLGAGAHLSKGRLYAGFPK